MNYAPVNGWYAGDVVLCTDALGEQTVAYLPGEHGRVLPLVIRYSVYHGRRGHFGFRSANHAGFEASCFVVSGEDFRDTAVRDTQLARNVTGPDAVMGQLHNPLAHHIRKRSSVHKHSPQLIHAAVAWGRDLIPGWLFSLKFWRFRFGGDFCVLISGGCGGFIRKIKRARLVQRIKDLERERWWGGRVNFPRGIILEIFKKDWTEFLVN